VLGATYGSSIGGAGAAIGPGGGAIEAGGGGCGLEQAASSAKAAATISGWAIFGTGFSLAFSGITR
jgi:hypothetical protein